MTERFRDRTIALAGVVQAAQLVQSIARTGMCDGNALNASLGSVFAIDAPSTDDVYGGTSRLSLGLHTLRALLSGPRTDQHPELMRYVVAMLQLERQVTANRDAQTHLGEGIERIRPLIEQTSLLDSTVSAQLATLYRENISPLSPRIMVSGEPTQLANSDNANRIRALLLAGIRSAVLWRQKGGTRWQLMLGRNAIVQTIDAIRREAAGP